MLSFFRAVIAFPALVSFFLKVSAFIQEKIHQALTQKAEEELARAIITARATKDSSGIDIAFDVRKKKDETQK